MSGHAAVALAVQRDRGQFRTSRIRARGEPVPPGERESPFPLDLYLSWMSPGLTRVLRDVAHCKTSLAVIGDLHEFKRVFRHRGLCGRASPRLYSVDISVLGLVETLDYPGLSRLDYFDDVIVGEFSRYAHGREVYQRITARAERFGAAMSPTNYYWR